MGEGGGYFLKENRWEKRRDFLPHHERAPSSKLTWLVGNSPFPIGNTSSNGGFFHCYVSLPEGNIFLFQEPVDPLVELDFYLSGRV